MLNKILNHKRLFSYTLYTWGQNKDSVGHDSENIPLKINGFDNKITKVTMGPNHSAFLTNENKFYMFGSNSYGKLGHPLSTKKIKNPTLISYFEDKNIIVKDFALGKSHSLVLDNNGYVYSFGQGKRKFLFLLDIFFPQVCALGHKNIKDKEPAPRRIKNLSNIKQILSGFNNGLAIDENNEVNVWGRGEYGVLGLGYNKQCYEPVKNKLISEISASIDSKIKKIRTVGSFTTILYENGDLYSFGTNEHGQMGNDAYLGIDVYESVNYPFQVKKEYFNNERITDFEIGEQISVFKTENNKFYWCGRKIVLRPELIPLENSDKITVFGCSSNGFAFVYDNNDIYYSNNFFKKIKSEENLDTGIFKLDENYFNGKIVEIGGGYYNKYVLVKQ